MDTSPYAPPGAQPPDSQVICNSCGIMLSPGSRACSGCGAPVGPKNLKGEVRENYELRALAREQLQGGWLTAVAVSFVYLVIGSGFHIVDIFLGWMVPGYVVQFIVGGPATLGFSIYFLNNARGQPARFGDLFEGFRSFGKSFLLYLLFMLFGMLWSLLLIVPGIIKMSLSYSMSYFILRDNPEISALEAITRSRKMMYGYKWKLCTLYLSFAGWGLLSILSLGIGSLWLLPYVMQSMANFYEDIKHNAD